MNWSSSHPLHHALFYSPDAMSDNVPILFLSFLSPAISIVLYMMRMYLLYLKIFRPLKQHKTSVLFSDYRFNDPLIHFNHTTKITIINMSSLHTHTHIHASSSTHKSIPIIYTDKRRNTYKWKKANRRKDLTSQLKSNIMYKVVRATKQDVASHIKWWSKWIENN